MMKGKKKQHVSQVWADEAFANANKQRKKERTGERRGRKKQKRKPMSGQVETLYLCMCDKDIWANYVIAISGPRVDGKREHNI